ncbi:MAG: hypothetical protein AAGF15_04670 [Pseudomonadota bacterium]
MARPLFYLSICALTSVAVFSAGPAQADFLETFAGNDPTATSRATAPNSVAAEEAFLNAIGPAQLVDFERTGLESGDIIGQTLTSDQLWADGLTISSNDLAPSAEDLGLNRVDSCGTLGFNLSLGGGNNLSFCEAGAGEPVAELIFSFSMPVDAFGLYLTGSDRGGTASLIAGDDELFPVSFGPRSYTSGAQYLGFIRDEGLSEVILRLTPNRRSNGLDFGIDDVSFRTVATDIPAPAMAGLFAIGILGLAIQRSRPRPLPECDAAQL